MINSVEKKYNQEGNFINYYVIWEDGLEAFVPLDEGNRHYQEIQQWIADGGTVIDNPPEETP